MEKVFEPGLATMTNHEDISKNSQKLFNYLTCLAGNPPNMQKRIFQHKNINLSEISRTIDISVNSLKKYWFELELHGKIIYGNNNRLPEEEVRIMNEIMKEMGYENEFEIPKDKLFEIWKKQWTARKKRPCEYYEVRAGIHSRNIPKETIKALNEELHFSEQDIKLYQFLLTYREVGIKKMYKTFDFSMMDLRNFLGKKREKKNHISIYKSLLLLQKYELIDFEEKYILNQKNARIRHFILTNVNFYIKKEYRDFEDEEMQYINQNILNEINEIIKENYTGDEE